MKFFGELLNTLGKTTFYVFFIVMDLALLFVKEYYGNSLNLPPDNFDAAVYISDHLGNYALLILVCIVFFIITLILALALVKRIRDIANEEVYESKPIIALKGFLLVTIFILDIFILK